MTETQKELFTEPKICRSSDGEWFIYFNFWNEVKKRYQIIKRSEKLNYIKDELEKELAFRGLRNARHQWLKDGWNPIVDPKFEKRLVIQAETSASEILSFSKALLFAFQNCIVSKKTKSCYKTTVKYITEAAEVLKMADITIDKIKKRHIKMMLNKARELHKWSNNNFNKNHQHLSAILTRLDDFEMIEYNPALKIKKLPVTETQKFAPYTEEEKKTIWGYFYMNHYKYLIYFLVIYFTGIRPKEVLALRIKDIDLNTRRITIIPDLTEENSKTKKIRIIPISNELFPFLRELLLQEYPGHYFVFGNFYEYIETGKISSNGYKVTSGWKLYPEREPNFFAPSPYPIRRDTATKFWKRVIIDKLGIKKFQYAAKHTGANAMILAGIDLDTLKELYGHSSKLMTERYATRVVEVHAKTIIEKTPAFLADHSMHSPSR